ncbi:hypothetical protein [Streptomyces sp. NPDC056600]|uniref:hypothetical protein n=1 Tax=Streptomyces sp. NPDC056600 TaxID=3345874 RepID=UPI0036A61307
MGGQLVLTIVAVLGSLGGVVLGGRLTARRDDIQWARQQRQRQEDLLRGACAGFVAAAVECRRLLEQLHYFHQVGRDAEILAFGDEYNHRSRDLHREAAQLRLSGSAALYDAADAVVDACAETVRAVKAAERVRRAEDALVGSRELDAFTGAVNAFIDQARPHGGALPALSAEE